MEETSKSIITDLQVENTIDQLSKTMTIEEGTTNYEDATVLAAEDDSRTLRPSMFNMPSFGNLSDDEDYIRSDYSSDSTNCLNSVSHRRFKNYFHTPHKRRTAVGNTDFSVYSAQVSHRFGRRFPAPKSAKRSNLKWKIVINNHSREAALPSTSTSELQLSNRKKCPCKDYSKSGISFWLWF